MNPGLPLAIHVYHQSFDLGEPGTCEPGTWNTLSNAAPQLLMSMRNRDGIDPVGLNLAVGDFLDLAQNVRRVIAIPAAAANAYGYILEDNKSVFMLEDLSLHRFPADRPVIMRKRPDSVKRPTIATELASSAAIPWIV